MNDDRKPMGARELDAWWNTERLINQLPTMHVRDYRRLRLALEEREVLRAERLEMLRFIRDNAPQYYKRLEAHMIGGHK